MKSIILWIFVVLCKPGVVHEVDDTETALLGDTYAYYYYELDQPDGSYVYISFNRDTVPFYVIEDSAYYTYPEDTLRNREFQILN
jgi:hypothetical protein